ncbi:Ig-like domain-containing protein [Myxococcus sp. AM011]|uniref:Ig-like domain-containing protein n=1 Tax=Myxococcus sp. AM011 TaxID=2745200 RepID=UPI0015958E05|nr:Ig-like domain-containing protein [Myxococcus sp. AM011]NVJ26116.1 Ig-like domain-containing protein [Myxococcus sp. AM011]
MKLIVPLLIGALVACSDSDSGPVTVTPKTVTVKAGEKATFSASVKDAKDPRVLWSVEGGDSHGTISSSGIYTAPAEAGTYTVVATNAVDTSKKDTATVKVEAVQTPTVIVKVTPEVVTIGQGTSTDLTAEVSGSSITAVQWSVEGGDENGTVSSTGRYTAPNAPGTYTVTATSVADPTKKGSASVTVEPVVVGEVTVTVSPSSGSTTWDGTVQLTAEVTGTNNLAVQWSVEGGDANGFVSSTGVYRAPKKTGTFTVTATSVADPTKKGSASITVEAVVVEEVAVTVSPKTGTVEQDGSFSLSAHVTGTNNLAVQWAVAGGDDNGTVSSTGVYRAPRRAGTFTVTATSVADPTRSDSATLTVDPIVVPTVAVSVTPKTATVGPGAVVNLTAEVTGTSVVAVIWAVEGGSANGTVSSTGVYTAPGRPGTYTVTATSVADASKTDSAVITVPVASTVAYVDPTGTGWRLVRNASLSSGNTLVLDLVGPTGQSGRGADLTLGLDAATASWSTVDGSEYVANRGYELGAAPHLLKSGVKGSRLSVGVYQKDAPAHAYDGALLSVSLTVEANAETPAGTVVPLNVIKAHALPASGSLQSINVAVGTLTTAQ